MPINNLNKMTENQVIKCLINYLEKKEWFIEKYCLGQEKGYDIIATRNSQKMIIEAKGAMADDASPTKKRSHFNSGQIKTHFGKAIVKALETKYSFPDAIVSIAHPYDNDIKKTIGHLIDFLKELNIKHFWVKEDCTIIET